MQEVEPHVEEQQGTVKSSMQKYLLLLGAFISLAFIFGLYNAFQSDAEKKAEKAAEKAAAEQPAEKTEQVATAQAKEIGDFDKQVDAKVEQLKRSQQRQAEAQPLKEARQEYRESKKPIQEPIVVESQSKDKSAYDSFKEQVVGTGKVRTLADIERLADSKVRLSKTQEDFAVSEKRRALEARKSSLMLTPVSNAGVPQAAVKPQVKPQRESIDEKLQRVRAKAAEAQQLRDKLLSGNYQNSDLARLSQDIAAIQSNPVRYSREQTNEPKRIVGASLNKAKNLGLKGVKLPTGTAIKAVLSQTVMSDYANKPFKAQLTQDVYDADYETILFPKGTIVDGRAVRVGNVNEAIQARMGLTINWFVLPNGNRVDFSKSASALDTQGIGGIKDDVDYHAMEQFLGVLAYAVVASETSSATSSSFTGQTNIGGDVGKGIRQQVSPIISRYLSLVPTITLNTGTPITIYIENEMQVEPWGTIYDDLY